eukprot:tig00000857_g4946.t1
MSARSTDPRDIERRVYVGRISGRTRDKDINDLFARYGKITRFDMKYGYAFIEYDDPKDAEDAISKLDNFEIDGSRLQVERARGPQVDSGGARARGPMRGEFRCLVLDMAPNTSWQDLKDFARNAGSVVFTDVFMDRGRKVGVIEYASREDVKEALHRLDDTRLHDVRVRVREDDGRFDHVVRNRGGGGGGGGYGGGYGGGRGSYGGYDRRDDRRDRSPDRSRRRSRSRSRSPRRRSRSRSRDRGDRADRDRRSKSPEEKRQKTERSPPRDDAAPPKEDREREREEARD